MPWLQPPPRMPTLPAQTSDDTMSNACRQGYHQPYPEEGNFMMGMTPPPPRPNTLCEHPIFDATDAPATLGTLQLHLWSTFLDLYPDQAFAVQLRGALQHGVKLGYDGPLRHNSRLDVVNLPMDSDDVHHLHREIQARLAEGRLRHVTDPVGMHLVCSPVGVVPKPRSDKRRTIYHLSHPRKSGTRLPSINDGIATSFVTIDYESLDTIMDFICEHPSASLWKADLEDAFRHIIVAESDARLMGIHFDASPSPTSHSDISHYLDNFFGISDTTASPATPIQVLSLSAAALGFKLSHKKTVWETTKLEILGIELDSVAQTASITLPRHQHILQLCSHILERGRASLLELQQVAGHLQFVTRAWDGVSLLQPSPLVIEHVWTDASKRCLGGHWGSIDCPSAVFTKELSRWHRQKDIRFLEALAVLEALRRFSPSWDGPCRVVIHVDNENMEYGLRKGSIRDPQTQVLFQAIFALCLQWHIDLVPVRVSSAANALSDALSRRRFAFIQQQYPCAFALLHFNTVNTARSPPSFLRTTGLSAAATFLLWNGLATSTRARSSPVCADFATSQRCHPFPASETLLIEWTTSQHTSGKTYGSIKRDLTIVKSWHIDLGLSTAAFDSERLARVARGLKRVIGDPLPIAKLAITLPLLCQLLCALPMVWPSRHNCQMFRAAFCLAFACFLRSGELTWEAQGTHNMLTVGSVSFAADRSYATVTIPASKTDPFWQGATLTAPAVPLSTCAVSALRVVCGLRPPSSPLLLLDDDRPFDRSSFVATLRQCLATCGVEPSAYSGHSFRHGAATWAASNGVDDTTIRGLGRWRSACFHRYIDKSAADRATITKVVLYTNTSAPLSLTTVAWRNL
ncbi:hypothetical protein NDA18_003695 [Ustilago nuda]|nr:hypothetical protein NDA18_003695 [Ustilago nuda]